MMSSARIYVVILFFWAVLTVVTPMLVRLSASANLYSGFEGEGGEGVKKLLSSRRALVESITSPELAPAPAPAPESGGVSRRTNGFSDKFRSRVVGISRVS